MSNNPFKFFQLGSMIDEYLYGKLPTNFDFVNFFPSYPKTNCYYVADTSEWVLECAVAGLSKEDVDVMVEENTLTIKGVKKPETEYKNPVYNALARRDFEVAYKLSDKLDVDNIKVKLENGLLVVRIPMKKEAIPKRVKLTVE